MFNEELVKQYEVGYKRKQWYRSWRLIGKAHMEWIEPYVEELFRRGAYPISHLNIANGYEDKRDAAIASFVGALSVGDGMDCMKQIDKYRTLLTEHPWQMFCDRGFVHWPVSYQPTAVMLDTLFRIYRQYGSIQEGVLSYLRWSEDPGEALYQLLKENGVNISLARCRQIIIQLATDVGYGLDVWQCFDKNGILPPMDELAKWYVMEMFPNDHTFDFMDKVSIMTDTEPYMLTYQAMVMKLMQIANPEIFRNYTWRFIHTFYSYPVEGNVFRASTTPYEFIRIGTPIYDWDACTLTRNPDMGYWVDYDKNFRESEKYKQYMAEHAK